MLLSFLQDLRELGWMGHHILQAHKNLQWKGQGAERLDVVVLSQDIPVSVQDFAAQEVNRGNF
eukprot:GAFH01003858.1.p6 GENE.GAFH01003858.1~~GAFH01003858.1.p6  ORF type:complete len:63 (-),score=6.94 GAFH01003858.1:292-480(-)